MAKQSSSYGFLLRKILLKKYFMFDRSDSTKTIKLLALVFYEMMVDSVFAVIIII